MQAVNAVAAFSLNWFSFVFTLQLGLLVATCVGSSCLAAASEVN